MTRRQRQRAFRGTLYAVFVLAIAGLLLVADWGRIASQFFDPEISRAMFPGIVTIAAKNTVVYTAVAFFFGLLGGLLLALMRLSPIAPYRWVATFYIEVFRALPALLTIFLFAFGIPIAFGWRAPGGVTGAGVIGLVVVAAAYMAETIRAGIEAVPRGQVEAARSLGMSPGWAMISVVLPQAFRIVIPPLTNELVLLIKDTSLLAFAGATVASRELLGYARVELFNYGNSSPLIVAGAIYAAITIPLTQLVRVLERRNRRSR
ncbi:amino acid ABC transporter permease [Egicoccus sp. AB-alg2]|uniref:amino acid ABC transporter permease n=1 Tax=Egicoccus sp. AB-alg2 TaxID=3242693 RepID=UPI00359CE3B0